MSIKIFKLSNSFYSSNQLIGKSRSVSNNSTSSKLGYCFSETFFSKSQKSEGNISLRKFACSTSNDHSKFTRVYQEAINISNDDPDFTAKDAINKGFAYLAADKRLFSWSAMACFEKAKKLDKLHKYTADIECGIKQATSKKNEKPCYHALD